MIGKYPQDASAALKNSRRLRFVVVLGILTVLALVLLDSLESALERAEQQAAKLTLNQIRSALVVKGAEIRLNGQRRLEDQEGANPFEWFDEAPAGYTGICLSGMPEPGKWCFKPLQRGNTGYKNPEQSGRGKVIFRPNQPIILEERRGNRGLPLAWMVGIEYRDRNGNGRLDDDEPQTGLKLEPIGVRQVPESENPQGSAL